MNDLDNRVIEESSKKKAAAPSLTIKSWMDEDFGIIDLAGSLMLSPSLTNLRETARILLGNADLRGLIMQVQSLTYTDSAGLGELTIVYSYAKKRSCPLRLVGVPANLAKMLEMTRLDGLLQAADSVAIAKKQMKG